MTWEIVVGFAGGWHTISHIIPVDDLKDHLLDCKCWCVPSLDEEDWVATHNSADGREDFESGVRKPS